MKNPPLPTRLILFTPVHLLAFGFGAGLAPRAPGTVGTLVGIPFALAVIAMPPLQMVVALAFLIGAGIYLCGESARLLGVHDHGGIVFDEIVGYVIACLPLMPILRPEGLSLVVGLLLAFGLFRFFDIVKPWPIRWLDRHVHGGLGIMVDDLLAGVFAAVILYVGNLAYS
ncbi:phosphatidylglycerophosphatase A [Flagellatimonas centrodinii]|uniref:phosphatidylglycerophosphatase A family protein n=1 Tax=Flagellatimonas centrodinii TaxID=2806210 RepID=UPI001FEFC8A3|nr:phosphatidylglycerophosphatase A [Flagellatimonas centrodinii]ULQ46196.1 phosphatidylglycerophosphatase A [Flagellatimonas centrodinii]